MSEIEYPVAFRHRVPPKTSILQSMKSRLRDIPNDRQDYAVVLDFAGVFELVPSGTPIARAEGIGSASAMIFVDVRPVFLDIELDLPCQGHVERRKVTVRYLSQVVAPEIVLQDRVERLQNKLEYWTRSLVARESVGYGVDDHERFLAAARSAVASRLLEQPPVSPAGIELQLVEVSAELPTSSLAHQQHLIEKTRDADRRIHDVNEDGRVASVSRRREHDEELEMSGFAEERWRARQSLADEQREKAIWQQQADAARLEEAYRRGPEALLALMAAKDPAAMEQLVAYGIKDRDFLADLLLRAAQSGVVSSSAVEDLLTNAANELLRGSGAQVGTGPPASELDRGARRGSVGAGDTEADDDFDPDDDEFDDRPIDSGDGLDDLISTMFKNKEAGAGQPAAGGTGPGADGAGPGGVDDPGPPPPAAAAETNGADLGL